MKSQIIVKSNIFDKINYMSITLSVLTDSCSCGAVSVHTTGEEKKGKWKRKREEKTLYCNRHTRNFMMMMMTMIWTLAGLRTMRGSEGRKSPSRVQGQLPGDLTTFS